MDCTECGTDNEFGHAPYCAYNPNPTETCQVCGAPQGSPHGESQSPDAPYTWAIVCAQWEIRDWVNNLLFHGQTFDSFEDGWSHIYENVADEDSAYDDFYVVQVKGN